MSNKVELEISADAARFISAVRDAAENFQSAFARIETGAGKSNAAIREIEDELRKLQQTGQSIELLDKAAGGVRSVQTELAAAEAKARQLRAALSEALNAGANNSTVGKLESQLSAADRAAERAAKSLQDAQAKLVALNLQSERTGVSTGNLAEQKARLASALRESSARLEDERQKLSAASAAQEQAAQNTARLGAAFGALNIRSLAEINNDARRASQAFNDIAANAGRSSQEAQRAYQALQVRLRELGEESKRAGGGMQGAFTGTSGALGTLRNAIAGVSLIALAGSFVKTADAMTNLNSKIRLSTEGLAELQRVKASLLQIANETGISVQHAGEGYSRMAASVKEAGGNTQDALNVTRAFSLAAKISGATSAEASSAMIQLGQAMASGKLQGDELKSLMEASPRFTRALADALGVPIGNLKKMGEDGEITADKILKVTTQLSKLEEEAGSMETTIANAMTRLTNASWEKWVSDTNASAGAARDLAQAITWVADNFDSVTQAIFPISSAFTGLSGLVRNLVNEFGHITNQTVSTGSIFATLGTVLLAVVHPIGAVVAGFGLMYTAMARIQGWMGADKLREATAESKRLSDIFAGMVPIMNKLNGAGLYGLTLKIGEIQKAAIQSGADGKQALAIAQDFASNAIRLHTKLQDDKKKLDESYADRAKILAGEIKQTEKERVDAQIKDIQRLKQERESELKKALSDLEKYQTAAANAYAKAADAQMSTADKIRELRRRDMSEELKQSDIAAQANEKIIAARQKLAEATRLAAEGDTKGAERAAANAEKLAQQAESLGGSLKNTAKAIGIVGEAGKIIEDSEKTVGKANDNAAKSAETAVKSIKASLEELEQRLKEAETKKRLIEVDADIKKLEEAVKAGQTKLDELQQKSPAEIVADAGQALSEIGNVDNLLSSLDGKTAHTYVVTHYEEAHAAGGPVGLGRPLRLAAGGPSYRRISGAVSGPGSSTSDSIPAMLSNGEFVVRAAAVRRLGLDFMHAINSGGYIPQPEMPRLALGGLVGESAGSAPAQRDIIDLRIDIGGQKHTVQSSRDTARNLAAALRELARG